MKTKVFSRQDLYDKVWSGPLQSILQQFDVSYSELRRICVDMNIPLPQVGHWQKVRFKKEFVQPPLPLNYEGSLEVTLALKDESASKRTSRKSTSSILNEEIESELQEMFKLQEKLRNPDKLVIAAKKYLAGQKADNYKYIGTKNCGWDYLNMRMAAENIDRALQIMDTLIKALRVRGHDLQVKNHSTVATVHGQEFKILLRERTKREVSVENSWSRSVFIPTGILTIKLDSYLQKEWMDGKLKLEEQLSAIIAYLEIKAKEKNERGAERKREKEEREREKRRLQEFEECQEKELAAFKAVLSSASRWHKANNFRQYIDAVEAKAKAIGPISRELNDWLSWARRKADWYDPFVEGNDELLNGIDKETLIVKKKFPNYFG